MTIMILDNDTHDDVDDDDMRLCCMVGWRGEKGLFLMTKWMNRCKHLWVNEMGHSNLLIGSFDSRKHNEAMFFSFSRM